VPETFGTPAYSADGVVAAPHYLASLAGIEVLRDGGSAVDAAIATNLVLSVVWPQMCGPGGDLFAQVWSARDGRIFGLNASGRAGRGMTLDTYAAHGHAQMPNRGPLTVTVPGAVDGWFALHERFGRLPFDRIARDAIHHARHGYRLTSFVASAIRSNAKLLAQIGDGAEVFGSSPHAGDALVQADLANTLESLAAKARSYMYEGELGERIVAFLRANRGGLEPEDFSAQRSEWVEPLSTDYRALTVCELPPNSQGVVLLEILNMLDGVDLNEWELSERIHQLVERKKLAFADRDARVADPACGPVDVSLLLDRGYAHELAQRIGSDALAPTRSSVGRSVDVAGDTIFLCTADRDGNVVSLIQSLYAAFGSGIHVPGTGVTLHNRGFGFNLQSGHPNCVAPGKRPMHTLMPGLALRDGQPWLAFGTRGADGQPQTALQLLTGMLDFGLTLQAAMEAPRWAHGAPGGNYPASALVLESRFGAAVATELQARGHQVMLADAVDPVMGTAQMIEIDQARGCFIAASDPRGDGVALAL
jgi:gamma-glutamyltranspeptidase